MSPLRLQYADIPRIASRLDGDGSSEMNQAAIDAEKIKAVLVKARAHTATFTELGETYDLAAKYNLRESIKELQDEIRLRLPPVLTQNGRRKAAMRNLCVGLGIGVTAGIATHFMLVGIGQRRLGAR